MSEIAPVGRHGGSDESDLDARIDGEHRRANGEGAIVLVSTFGVLGPVAGPDLLPSEASALVAAGVGPSAEHLVADFPELDPHRVRVAAVGAQPGPVADRFPVDAVAVDTDWRCIVDGSVEEAHRRRRLLGGLVDRDRPHPGKVGGFQETDEVCRSRRPRPEASRLGAFASKPVVEIAPASARHPDQRRTAVNGRSVERRVGEQLGACPGGEVGAEHSRIDGSRCPCRVDEH